MSEEKFEECSLKEATHFEINGVKHELRGNDGYRYNGFYAGIGWGKEIYYLPLGLLATFGIKPLKQVKTEPVEFEAVFAEYNGKWHPLYNLDDNYAYQNDKKVRFKCVQILEEKE